MGQAGEEYSVKYKQNQIEAIARSKKITFKKIRQDEFAKRIDVSVGEGSCVTSERTKFLKYLLHRENHSKRRTPHFSASHRVAKMPNRTGRYIVLES